MTPQEWQTQNPEKVERYESALKEFDEEYYPSFCDHIRREILLSSDIPNNVPHEEAEKVIDNYFVVVNYRHRQLYAQHKTFDKVFYFESYKRIEQRLVSIIRTALDRL